MKARSVKDKYYKTDDIIFKYSLSRGDLQKILDLIQNGPEGRLTSGNKMDFLDWLDILGDICSRLKKAELESRSSNTKQKMKM